MPSSMPPITTSSLAPEPNVLQMLAEMARSSAPNT